MQEKKLNNKINLNPIIQLLLNIADEGLKSPLEENRKGGTWLADWSSVYLSMSDVAQVLMRNKTDDFDRYRDSLLNIVTYLIQDPPDLITVGGTDDLFIMAKNSVRGRAFESLVLFVDRDGETLKDDVKKLYEEVLCTEKTQTMMFMFGHYLSTFYYRDVSWVRKMMPKIFPANNPNKKELFLASFTGHLTNNLFKEIFFEPYIQKLYSQGVDLSLDEEIYEKYLSKPSHIDIFAAHFALAFLYYKEDFAFENTLFKKFWKQGNIKHHKSFIDFIGFNFILEKKDTSKIEELIKDPNFVECIKNFWDWMLEHYEKDSSVFERFGSWINLKNKIFEPQWLAEHLKRTLEKTGGGLNYGYGIKDNIVALTKADPKSTLEIARLHFTAGVKNRQDDWRGMYFEFQEEWTEVFTILYKHPETKRDAYNLINALLRDGRGTFDKLEDIIKQK